MRKPRSVHGGAFCTTLFWHTLYTTSNKPVQDLSHLVVKVLHVGVHDLFGAVGVASFDGLYQVHVLLNGGREKAQLRQSQIP